ncbi:MAG: N-acetylmuramoyl-L-alanine amidase [Bacteroidia bacterium]
MKKKYSLLFFTVLISVALSAKEIIENPFQNFFNESYKENPSIPKGILEAVSYSQTRFANIQLQPVASCIGIPQVYGPMGLTLDGKGYFRNNLELVSKLSGIARDEIISSPEKNIKAYAKAYARLQEKLKTGKEVSQQIPVLVALSELPSDGDLQRNFALNSQLYVIYWFLSDGEFQDSYGFPDHGIKFEEIFGAENYRILSSSKVSIGQNTIKGKDGSTYKVAGFNTVQSTDYGPALWNAAATCNYSSRNGTAISAVTIHDVEGTYAGCISWFQNCSASVSAHYVVRSSDGQITEMVLESNKAWHVGSENGYTIGIEHEGYNNVSTWYTTAMYTQSAALVADICASGYGIDPLRTYNGPSCSGSCVLGGCVKVKGHQHYPNQTHNDPGPYWDWYKYYDLINNAPSVTTMSAASGTFYDSGGASGNYANDERDVILIQPPGATSITLNFSVFDLETNWDYMYIYDGATVNDPLIGRFTSTTGPGVVTSSGGSLLIDFRSDCNTTNAGWAANYTSNVAVPQSSDNTAPTTSVFANGNWQTQNFTAAIVDADNSGGSGVEKGYYQVIDFDGTEWRANNTHGFFADNFDAAIHPDWTQSTGTWGINNQALSQSDEVSSNTNIYASLTQNLSNRYLYHFYAKIDGAGTNRRAGFHFFCDQPDSLNRGNSYFVWFRVDNSKLQIYETTNNSFGSPVLDVTMTVNAGQWYDYKVIYDRITGKISVYQDNAMVGTWTDPTPISNGNYISFRSGNANFEINELKVYRSRATTVNVAVGPGNSKDARFQNPDPQTFACKIKSICADSATNLSAIYYQNVNIDWTPPMPVDSIRDGLASDINITSSLNTLSANWDASYDTNSAISRYWYCIGTSPGDSDVVNWTGNMVATSVTQTGLSLLQGQFYYFSVRAENGAGLVWSKITSNGQQVDTTTASVGLNVLQAIWSGLDVYPNPFAKSFILRYQLAGNTLVKISIVDVLGKDVVLKTAEENAGKYELSVNTESAGLSQGIYLLKISFGDQSKFIRMIKE